MIGVPTYRRTERLRTLLRSLAPAIASGAEIVVADNGCEAATRGVAAEFAGVRYLAVEQRGISHVRNRLIDEALASGVEWMGMLDDDLIAPPDWLERMLATAREHVADFVGAPYASDTDVDDPVIAQSIFFARPRPRTGPLDVFHTGGNLLAATAFLRAHPRIRFDPALGLSGGEDYDFFEQALQAEAAFVWCDEAFCVEDVDTARLNRRAVLFRYFSTGNSMAFIDRKRAPLPRVAGRFAATFARGVGKAGLGVLSGRRATAIDGMFTAFWGAGGLYWLVSGLRLERYR